MIRLSFIMILLAISFTSWSQVNLEYQEPSKELLELVDAPMPPSVIADRLGETFILREYNRYKMINELYEPEIRLAGLRIDPNSYVSSRLRYFNNMSIMKMPGKEVKPIKGIPEKSRIAYFSWAPDQKHFAFIINDGNGASLWLADIETGSAKKLFDQYLNAAMGTPFVWINNNELLVKALPVGHKEIIAKETAVPVGPRISVSSGTKAQNRTYQDLLKDKTDEENFKRLCTAEIFKVDINGATSKWAEPALYRGLNPSPDGKYVIVTKIQKPFSYQVPYYLFPSDVLLYDASGKELETLEKVPLLEDLPKGFMATRKGKRSISWRSDKPSTLIWVQAFDGGDPAVEVEHRDGLFQQAYPGNDKPQLLIKTINRFSGVRWANDDIAIVYDRWWNTRNSKTYLINPKVDGGDPVILFDRNYQDRYNDPGSFISEVNEYGRSVLIVQKGKMYLNGRGYTSEGPKPFIDEYSIKKKTTKQLWQAENKTKLEKISMIIDIKSGKMLTRIESPTEFPNYYLKSFKSDKINEQITAFENPFKSIDGLHKEVVKYKRADGVELSGTLYLPADYEIGSGKKLPLIMWAYPTEFKDKASAGQSTSSPLEFTYVSYGSPVLWAAKGYAVLDDASFPIIGEGDEEPNDKFIEQLVMNAEAAIDYLDSLGYIDPTKVAVGGHSYGAFMTANLLTHSNLFAAGIARSGAYNRTLTPFGFQAEERSYWEAPNIYYNMSPFMHADKMKTPLLLIHGEADNNSGTYPMQSERYFNALKGHGAPVRLVMLPGESHGYSARESVLHLIWEQDMWLEKYLK